jgi:F-type H+-transporting ATPase subunit gamma
MAKTREIRRRIRSITSTRKVTKAMELVASAKMRRAVTAMQAARGYANLAWQLLLNVARRTDAEQHPLLRRGEATRVGVLVVTSNRGLVGSFNTQLISAVLGFLRGERSEGADVVLVGRKGRTLLVRAGVNLTGVFEKLDVVTDVEHVRPIARLALDSFLAEKLDRVVLAYTDFKSTLVQKPVLRQILPIEPADILAGTAGVADRGEVVESAGVEYRFEPNADFVLEALLPRLLEMQVYRALLESAASEHAARMVAMQSATDAAGDLIDELSLAYNQARQQSITQDLAEISAGAAALTAETV